VTKEGEFVLPTIDAFAIPFVPDKKSPGESTAPSSEVHMSEAQTSQDNDDPPPMIDHPDNESSVDSDDKYCQQDYQDLDDESTDDEEASQEDYDLMHWLDYEEEKVYRSPMDSPPLKDMPCVKTVDDNEDLPPQHREARDKLHTNRLKTGNERAGIDLPSEEMIGQTVLMPPTAIGEHFRGRIIERVDKSHIDYKEHPKLIKFKCLVNDKYKEIVSYNQILDFIENDDSWDGVWKFREILTHKSGLRPHHPEYRGCGTSLLILWETGEATCPSNGRTPRQVYLTKTQSRWHCMR
jgi:hypothetical protein